MTHAFIGRMVLYRLTEEEALATNKRREDARQNAEKMREERPGFQAHVGYQVSEGRVFPMLIIAWKITVEDGHLSVNGQVFLDGNDSLWVTDAMEGDEPGQWEAITDG